MSSANLTAGQVMDLAAADLNDPNKSIYTYAVMLPYLRMALQELREDFELNGISVVQDTSAVIPVDAGVTEIGFQPNASNANTVLPADLVEPEQLWESNRGTDQYIPMRRKSFIPHNLQGVRTSYLGIWVWESNKIKLLGSNNDNDIKIDYTKQLFNNIVSEASPINVINASTFLHNRTAALCASLIGQNPTRSEELNIYAVNGLEKATGISIKGKQSIVTRRKPFRSGYKTRNRVW
jgi:hypothetical protein